MDSLEGRIEERQLPEVLLLLARQRSRGILTVQGDQEIIGLSIFEGQLVSADALNQSLEEGLGRILTTSGLVSNEVLANLACSLIEHKQIRRQVALHGRGQAGSLAGRFKLGDHLHGVDEARAFRVTSIVGERGEDLLACAPSCSASADSCTVYRVWPG